MCLTIWVTRLPETLMKRMGKIVSLLERIDENIEALKNASIRRQDARVRFRQVAGVDILSLDGHLQKTMLSILKQGLGKPVPEPTLTDGICPQRESRQSRALLCIEMRQRRF